MKKVKNYYYIIVLISCCQLMAFNPITIINFSGDNGYKHSSQAKGVEMIENLGKKYHWKVISTTDPAIFNDKVLSSVRLVVFNNNCGNEGKIFSKVQQESFKKFIANGGAYLGIHCAGAIWNEEGDFQQWYEALVGTRMVSHPAVQQATMIIETKNHPATQHLPAYWKLTDEYHTFTSNPRSKVTVLISVDENSYEGTPKMQGDHPMVWCQETGNSRSFFSALGHSEELYNDSNYQKMIAGGMVWAMRLENKENNKINSQGLILDLDADKGVYSNENNQVFKWENQVLNSKARFFEKRDEGRKIAGSGCPTLKNDIPELNHHSSIIFKEQELLNKEEDVFDHLTAGSGYTFFCILSPYKQNGKLKDVNSFFGNLKNGGMYEGFWGGLTDDNKFWSGARNAITIGRWDENNPFICTDKSLNENQYYLVMGKMDAGTNEVNLYVMVNEWDEKSKVQKIKVNSNTNASMMSIGQERDAIQHPGFESFDGEIARFVLYERPLKEKEMKNVIKQLKKAYDIK